MDTQIDIKVKDFVSQLKNTGCCNGPIIESDNEKGKMTCAIALKALNANLLAGWDVDIWDRAHD